MFINRSGLGLVAPASSQKYTFTPTVGFFRISTYGSIPWEAHRVACRGQLRQGCGRVMEKTYLPSTPLEAARRSMSRNGVWPMSTWQEPGPPRKEILFEFRTRCPAEVDG